MKFLDLFAGIGGFRAGLEQAGHTCVFTCERDKFCQKTYKANWPGHSIHPDVRTLDPEGLPPFDLLVAGFPCQPWSSAGTSKLASLGRATGFDDTDRGTLFFEIARILAARQPPMFLLENVPNLMRFQKGEPFRQMMITLQELGYYVRHCIIDSSPWVAQKRRRLYIVGFKNVEQGHRFQFPSSNAEGPSIWDILEPEPSAHLTLSDKLWSYLQAHRAKHARKGNGFGFGLLGHEDTKTRTLSARYNKDGSEILIGQYGPNPRRLSVRECARIMGFPDTFHLPVSDTQAYRQLGNSVVVPVVQAIGNSLNNVVIDRN